MPRTIFLDMDGVITDFMSAALRRHGREYDPATYPAGEWEIAKFLGCSETAFWKPLEGFDFWANLEPYPWFQRLLAGLERYGDVVLATSPSHDHMSPAGKVAWIQKHISTRFRSFLIGPQKYHMAKPGALLIDDSDKNVEKFVAHGGDAIIFPQRWNSLHAVSEDPADYVLRLLSERAG